MPFKPNSEPVLVHKIACVGEWEDLPNPMLSTEVKCYTCGSSVGYAVGIASVKDCEKVWMCANPHCLTMTDVSCPKATAIPVNTRRALEWPLFCEISGLGNKSYTISFEKVEQEAEKLSYMRQFVKCPEGIILMRGDRGGGKTYAALGMCEFFTRSNASCKFIKFKDLFDQWQRWNKQEGHNDLLTRLVNVTLLILDDFAISEPTPAFMTFFLQLLDKRVDWDNKGTVITTNLDVETLTRICGQTLMERLKCAKIFSFTKGSRRKFKPIQEK